MAIDLGRWFRDRKRQVEGVAAQVNPFDNGKTYSSVVQNTPVQTSTQVNQRSAQPPSNRTSNLINPQKPTWLDNQAFTVSSRPIAQPNFQAPKPNGSLQQEIDKSYGRGLSSLKNRLRDVVDSNTQADRIRRVAQTGLDESYQDQQARLTRDAMSRKDGDNIGAQTSGAFFKEGASFVGKSPSSIAQIQARVASSNNPLVRYGVGAVVPGAQYGLLPGGNKRGEQILRASQGINTTIDNKLQQSGLGDRADHNKWARGAGSVGFQLPALLATGPLGLAGMGSQTAADEANKAEMAGRTNEQALGIGLLQGGASMASEKFGLDRFLPGNGTAATSIKPFLGNMAKRIGTEGAQEAQQQFTQNLISNKTYNPNQGLKEGVFESAALGGLSGGAMSGAIDLPNVTRNTNIKLSPLDESGFIDVPKQDLIIRNGEGKAMSVEKDPLEALKAEARKFETLPTDIHPSIEAKAVGVKRIAPDRVGHQQLTPEAGIAKVIEQTKEMYDKRAAGWGKVANDADALIKKYGDKMPARTSGNLKKYPDLQKDYELYNYLRKNTYGRTPTLTSMKEQFTNNVERTGWNAQREALAKEAAPKAYIDAVKKDISKGYRYPEEVLNYDKSFRTAVDSRARYEKGLYTSFSSDDHRIVFDDQNRIAGGMKRQDGKELLPEQKEEIVSGILRTQDALGLNVDQLAKDNRWVYAHLNGKNPFLTNNAAGLYRPGKDHASISVGGTESFKITENGKLVNKRVNTTVAHELGHALDLSGDGRLFDRNALRELKNTYNSTDGGYRGRAYWSRDTEVTARAIAQYVDVKNGQLDVFDKPGNWNKEVFETTIKPEVERAIGAKYPQYKIAPNTPEITQPTAPVQKPTASTGYTNAESYARANTGNEILMPDGGKAKVIGSKDGKLILETTLPSGRPIQSFYGWDTTKKFILDKQDAIKASNAKNAEHAAQQAIANKQKADIAMEKKNLSGFTDGKTPLQIGRIETALDGKIRYQGAVMAKRDYIKKLIEDGYIPDETQNRMVNKNGKGDFYDTTKTEVEYARHLLSNNSAAPVQKADSIPQTRENRIIPRVGDTQLPIDKNIIIGDTTPLKKGNSRPDQLTTISGRKIQLDQYNPKGKDPSAKWNATLIDAAIEEAKSRNDSMNLGIFEDMKGRNYKNMSESDLSGIHQYLFGSPDSVRLTYGSTQPAPVQTNPLEALKAEASYRSAHQIDSSTSRNIGSLNNIDDIVGQVKSKYGLTNYDQKDIANLKKVVGDPEADVKIYRASPVNEINDGDWVTTSKTYANDIKRQNGGKVYEYTVKAKDLNLPANIEDNPSLARFSAFQYSKGTTQPPAPVQKPDPLEALKAEARKKAQQTEALKKQGKIKPNDDGYWTTPVEGQPKSPIPEVRDTNGILVKEGDVIEAPGVLGGNARRTIQWQKPQIANATGEYENGKWLGNGILETDANRPFTIVERDGKPFTQPTPPVQKPKAKSTNEQTDPVLKALTDHTGKNRPKGAFEIEQNKPQGRVVAPKTKPDVRNTKFATKTVQRSPEVSDAVKKGVKEADNSYELVHNKDQVARSEKFIKKNNIRNAVADVKERLNAKDFDDQAVSDAIAVAKKLDAKGGKANLAESTEIYEQLSKKLTKAGQTVQAARLLNNRTPEGMKHWAIKQLQKEGVKLDPKGTAKLEELIGNVRKAKPDTYDAGLSRYRVTEFVAKQMPHGATSKAIQIWKAGLLSSPRTTAGNLFANTAETIFKKGWVDPVATATDKLMSVFTGKRSRSLTVRGMPTGAKEGIVKGVKYFKTGYDPRNPDTKWDIRNIHFSDKPAGKAAEAYTQTIFRLMGAQDQPFYYANMRNSLYDQAITAAKNEGLKGTQRQAFIRKFVTEPTKDALELADKEGRYAVFQNETALGKAASRLKGMDGPAGDVAEFIMPFSGVPSSIATRIIERTPIGTATEIVKQIKKGKFDQRAMTKAIANGSAVVLLVGAGYALAEADMITLGYPKDKNERELWEAEGKQPYSIKQGDKWLSMNYFQPGGTIIAAGAEYKAALDRGESQADALKVATAGAGKAFTEQSFLKGVSGGLNAITDPVYAGEKFVDQTAGSVVPNFIRSTATATDDVKREARTVPDQIKRGIPGPWGRQTLDVKKDLFGRDVKENTTAPNVLLNPLRPSNIRNADDTTTQEIRRLTDADEGITPTQIKKDAFMKDGKGTKLTDKEVDDFNAEVGKAVKVEWDKIMADDRYSGMADDEKKKLLRKVNDDVYGALKRKYEADKGIGEYAADFTGKSTKLSTNEKRYLEGKAIDYYAKNSSERTPVEEYEYQKAKFDEEKDLYNEIERAQKETEIKKLGIKKDYDEVTTDLYNLNKSQLAKWLSTDEKGVDKQKLHDELIAYDQALYDAGLIKYKKFKGGVATGRNGKGGSRKGGGKSKIDIAQILSKSNLQVQHSQNLSKLLAGTTFKGTKTKPSTSKNKSKVAQKTIKVDMRA